ncbi:MAG: inverse autotransporter beta domain-containing protein [Candidatus Omnitrophica bacterium]|nr:inverse autotransporter beta domain-containing protein [Candidatus Omnitrophota bacterium]MDE2223210.1 inverse autotransporter beta domain-containing protein [Candidatus Omnitrophota bacterium]
MRLGLCLSLIVLISLIHPSFTWADASISPSSVNSISTSTADSVNSGISGGPASLSSIFSFIGNQLVNYAHKGIYKDAPDWLKRTEFHVTFDKIDGTEYSLLTTQPLWESTTQDKTVFTQVSYEHYKLYDIDRDTINTGFGYRQLFLNNTLLLGANNFYDYEISHNHARSSIGGDAKWGPLDFYSNYYYRLNGVQTVKGAQERVTNGYDVGIDSALPFLPWAKFHYGYYEWFGIYAKNTVGNEYSCELALTPNISLVGGTRGKTPESNRQDNFVLLSFHFGNKNKATLFSSPVSSHIFEQRDLSDDLLDKVNRENKIMVERTVTSGGGGLTVVIKKG